MALDKKHIDKLQLAGVVIAGVALLYELFKKSPQVGGAGSSVPVLLGSGGDSGGSGLSPTSGDGGATTLAPITIPANPPITTGSIYAPSTINTILGALANPGGFGCCGQNPSVPYNGVAPAQPGPPVVIPPLNIDPGYGAGAPYDNNGVPFDYENPLGFG